MISSKSALLFLIAAAIIWGATIPIMKITLVEIPVFSLIVIRMSLAAILLLPFAYKKLHVETGDFKNILLSAIFGTNLNLAFFFYGLEFSQAINGSLILATTPIFTLFVAHIFLKEKLNAKLVLGTLLAFIGVITIIGIPVFNFDVKSTVGNISLLLSAFAWVAHEIFAKKVLKKYHFLTISFYTMIIGASIFFPIALLELINKPNWFASISTPAILGLAFGVVFASFIAYSAWQAGLSKTSASQASFVFYLLPIFGIIFSVILLDETFTPILILGSVIIASGIILAEYHRNSHPHSFQKDG